MSQPSGPIEEVAHVATGLKFGQMSRVQKVVFVAKLAACIGTFGFAFPNVQHD
jgi:hypothetical protein